MDSIPFLHANRLFTIFFEDDLAFTEVRLILDFLLDRNAFDPHVQETAGRYLIDSEQANFTVWVSEMNVIIQRSFVIPP
ncbi:MAG: hypothetical protein FJ118_03270 [Deltaproteobacteria bacterium]|nr:hypothetical protein [Deltaproteobacteria bacterium]